MKALITIALATTKVTQVLSPQQSSPGTYMYTTLHTGDILMTVCTYMYILYNRNYVVDHIYSASLYDMMMCTAVCVDVKKGKPELTGSKPHSKSTSHPHTCEYIPQCAMHEVLYNPHLFAVVRMDSVVDVKKVWVETSLILVSLDFETRSGPLFSALSSGVWTYVHVCGSVDICRSLDMS